LLEVFYRILNLVFTNFKLGKFEVVIVSDFG